MFQVEDKVYNDRYGIGWIGMPAGDSSYVFFQDEDANVLMPLEEGGDIIGKVTYLDPAGLRGMPEEEVFDAGFYQIQKVTQAFMFIFDEAEQRYQPAPIEGAKSVRIRNTRTNKSFTVQLRDSHLYVCRHITNEALELMGDFGQLGKD